MTTLDELRRLERLASAAPWTTRLHQGAWRVLPPSGPWEVCDTGDDTPAAADDAALIAAARNALPALLRVAQEAADLIDALEEHDFSDSGISNELSESWEGLRAALAALEAPHD